MRVGPIGLFEELNSDFYIVKEEINIETQIYKKIGFKYLYFDNPVEKNNK